ncbi:MAG: adenylate/guanylate cyclase domain-containing protein [Mariprofundus sp.]|nr:adenylate/guanylate cyclase domain-containing protein [Mariprofundus sp.]
MRSLKPKSGSLAIKGNSKARQLLLLCMSFTAAISFLYLSGLFKPAHHLISDLLQTQLPASPTSKPIVYLLITDNSLIEADEVDGISWPWPRSAYGEAVRFLKNAGAAEIIFDVMFTERSVHGLADDISFSESFQGANVTLASLSSSKQNHMSKKLLKTNSLLTKPFTLNIQGIKKSALQDFPYLRAPVQELAARAKGIGDVKFIQDSDGIGRRVPLFIRSGDQFHPTLALSAAASLLGITSYQMQGQELIMTGDHIERRIPLDHQGMAHLHYFGDSNLYDKYLLLRLIKSQIKIDAGEPPYYAPALFKDKIVIIGSDATDLKDFRPNPFNKTNDTGAHYHATAIHNILENSFLTEHYDPLYVLPILLLSGLILALIMARQSAIVGFLYSFLLLLLIHSSALYLFIYHDLLIDISAASVNIIGCFILATGFNYVAESKQRHFITSAFGQYLAPGVVKALVDNPDRLLLGGEVRIMTAFFSDIQGFSTFSEKLSPEDLVTLLNEYLSEMCDIIGKHQGTVDKFEGDAIMAFWGAPLPMADHARLALLASLEMQQKLVEMRQKWATEGRDQLHVRMGLNSGPMLVGNMGSRTRMNYTIMGDAVNLASRLEAGNKFYGTYLMMTKATKELAGAGFVTRKLDCIQVIGKKKPVIIYEILGHEGTLSQVQLSAIKHFEKGLEHYHIGDFKLAKQCFTATLGLIPNDPPAQEFLRRLASIDKTPPTGEWNGIFKADIKG